MILMPGQAHQDSAQAFVGAEVLSCEIALKAQTDRRCPEGNWSNTGIKRCYNCLSGCLGHVVR